MRLEDKLQIAIVDLLKFKALPSTIYYHVPNGIPCSARVGARFKAMGMVAGVPDLCVIIAGGQAGFIEIKAPKGGLSLEQRLFRDRCLQLSIPHHIVRSLGEAERVLWAMGALKGPAPQVRSAA